MPNSGELSGQIPPVQSDQPPMLKPTAISTEAPVTTDNLAMYLRGRFLDVTHLAPEVINTHLSTPGASEPPPNTPEEYHGLWNTYMNVRGATEFEKVDLEGVRTVLEQDRKETETVRDELHAAFQIGTPEYNNAQEHLEEIQRYLKAIESSQAQRPSEASQLPSSKLQESEDTYTIVDHIATIQATPEPPQAAPVSQESDATSPTEITSQQSQQHKIGLQTLDETLLEQHLKEAAQTSQHQPIADTTTQDIEHKPTAILSPPTAQFPDALPAVQPAAALVSPAPVTTTPVEKKPVSTPLPAEAPRIPAELPGMQIGTIKMPDGSVHDLAYLDEIAPDKNVLDASFRGDDRVLILFPQDVNGTLLVVDNTTTYLQEQGDQVPAAVTIKPPDAGKSQRQIVEVIIENQERPTPFTAASLVVYDRAPSEGALQTLLKTFSFGKFKDKVGKLKIPAQEERVKQVIASLSALEKKP